MHQIAYALLGLLSLPLSSAAPHFDHLEERTSAGCTIFTFPVTASATNLMIVDPPADFTDPTVLEAFIVQNGEAIAGGALANGGGHEVNGTYNMRALYCPPLKDVPARRNTVQYLQHAITMRKEYWNGLTFPTGFKGEKYSYIDVARNNGYAIFAMDNLGNGDSAHPDPILVTQQTLQVEVIHQVLQMLRKGKIGGPVKNKAFKTLIYAGHSYGSICGNGVATHHPDDVDAFIFTGYTARFDLGAGPLAKGKPIPARLVHPKFAKLQDGYLADSDAVGRGEGLFTAPNSRGGFDPAFPAYDQLHEGTGSIGELATLLYGVGSAEQYKGHVYVLTGRRDAIVCNLPPTPNCGLGKGSLPAQAGAFFPNAKSYTYSIPLNTGHNANLHYTSPYQFKKVMTWLTSKGF